MNYFNVLFISSDNSIMGHMATLPGYYTLEFDELRLPNDSQLAEYYKMIGIKDAEFLAGVIGANFRYAEKIVLSNCTSGDKLRCKRFCFIL